MHNLDQHTLKEKEFIQQAVSLAQIKKKDSILEVGAGPGNITSCIAEKGAQVDAYEIDARWKPELEKIEKTYDNLVVYYQDALKADWHRYTLLISNVPFTNAEALIQKLLLSRIKLAVLFVSEHLAKVLQSDSKLGIVTRLFFTIRQIAKVPSKAFAPEPRTDAALLVLERSSSASFAEHVLKIMIMGKGKIKNTLQKGLTDYGYTKREAKVWIAQTRIAETTLNKPSKQSSAALLKRIQRELEKEA